MTANNASASDSDWKLPEEPSPIEPLGSWTKDHKTLGIIVEAKDVQAINTYAARLREIAEAEHKARVEAENHLLAADVMLQEMVKRAEAAEADNAALRLILFRLKGFCTWKELKTVESDGPGTDVIERLESYQDILNRLQLLDIGAELDLPPGDTIVDKILPWIRNANIEREAMLAASREQTQKLIRDAAAAKGKTAANSIHFGPVPKVEQATQTQRSKDDRLMTATITAQFMDAAGFDSTVTWTNPAQQVREAFAALRAEHQPCYTCDECHQSINGEPHKVEELDNVDPTDDQVRIWCAACWKAERDAGDKLELEALAEREADALKAEVERLRARQCSVCNDTGHLEDSQAWDCGQRDSECPYCPDKVQQARNDIAAAREALGKMRELIERAKSAGYGHDHWDPTMRRGSGCPLCIERREINDEIDKELAALAPASASEASGDSGDSAPEPYELNICRSCGAQSGHEPGCNSADARSEASGDSAGKKEGNE